MSFILDALKKSEGQRQRQSGPALFAVKLAPPRTRIPVWAVAVGGLLLVNLAAFGWMMLRPSSPPESAQPPAATAAAPVVSERQPTEMPPVIATGALPSPAGVEEDFEPQLIGDESDELSGAESEPLATFDEPAVARADGAPRVTRGTVLGVPTYDQLLARPGPAMPDLRLDLHVFANDPSGRFIFLNNTRLAEGDALPNGTRVESIVPDGAVLSVGSTRFLLQRQ
jgi:general secretion pathway protein B